MTQLGKYDIIEEIGRGGFGVVYKARDLSLERVVALKVLHPQLTVDTHFLERFRKEAKALARISHPNVVTVYEVGEEAGRIYIAMEYLPGGSLSDRLSQGPLSVAESLKIIQEVGLGLDAGHQEGLIHRDVKPGNILFNKNGHAVVADFGLAKAMTVSSMTVSTSYGGAVGTPSYRAPELWNGTPSPSPATDIYSLACVVYEMLTGEVLFEGDTPSSVMLKHFQSLPDLDQKLDQFSSLNSNAIKKALQKEPEERHQDTIRFFEDLSHIQEQHESNVKKLNTISESINSKKNRQQKTQPELSGDTTPNLINHSGNSSEKRRFSTSSIIIIFLAVAVLCFACAFLYFMPASWWCILTLDSLAGCPLP